MADMATASTENEWGLTIPLDRKYQPVIERAARRNLTKMAGYGRGLILKDLQDQGLLDADFEPVQIPEIPSE